MADEEVTLEDLAKDADGADAVDANTDGGDEQDAAKESSATIGQILTGVDSFPGSISDLEAVYDVPVRVTAVLGKSSVQVNHLLKLARGDVVELDRKVGEPIDIYVNDRLVARGEMVVVEDRLGITMTEIVKIERS